MQQTVQYERRGSIAVVTLDDGNGNALSSAVLQALAAAVDLAEAAAAAIIIKRRDGIFSAGFDLQNFARNNPDEIHEIVDLGAELALSLFVNPIPLIVACSGQAYPMGAVLLLASDLEIEADGPFLIGLNEASIGQTLPGFAVELARGTLAPPYCQRVKTGETRLRRALQAMSTVSWRRRTRRCRPRHGSFAEPVDVAAYRATKAKIQRAAATCICAAIDLESRFEKFRMRARR